VVGDPQPGRRPQPGRTALRLNDGALFNKEVAQATEAASADLQAALAASDDGSPAAAQAIRAGLVVEQSRNRAFEGVMARDPLLFDNLTWVVERGAAEGRRHTLLFAHNGHVDRTGQANGAPGQKLGKLAADHYGDAYRTIGTDGHRVSLKSQGETFSFDEAGEFGPFEHGRQPRATPSRARGRRGRPRAGWRRAACPWPS